MGLTSAHGRARRAKADSRRGDALNAPSRRQERARSDVMGTMTSLRRTAAVTLSVGSLAAILGGCGSSYCPPSGECVAIPSDVSFYARWLLAGAVLLVVGLWLLFAFTEQEFQFLGYAAVFALAAGLIQPGSTRPSVSALRKIVVDSRSSRLTTTATNPALDEDSPPPRPRLSSLHANEVAEPALDAPLPGRHPTPPSGIESPAPPPEPTAVEAAQSQLRATRATANDVRRTLQHRIEPLLEKYNDEFRAHIEQLRVELPRTGASSHDELLRHADQHRSVVNKLARAALLRDSLKWLTKKRKALVETLEELDQVAFRLSHELELNAVGGATNLADVRRTVASAARLLDELVDAPRKQDTAATEAEIFHVLHRGGA